MSHKKQTATNNIKNLSVFGLPSPIDTNIGKKICSKRCLKSFSQQAFAEILGIPESLLERIEQGKEKISVSLVWYVAALLETDIKYFFEDILPELNRQMFTLPEPEPSFLREDYRKYAKRIKLRHHKIRAS